ncbi:histidyl-tRNA synthetase domain-containing protein [Ditylenchus destructor]|nr:histidyl-tRNA synthetase domain-containing protein [Ditylenchus destructor]
MQRAGLTGLVLDLGDARLVRGLLGEHTLSEDRLTALVAAMAAKDAAGVAAFARELSPEVVASLQTLLKLYGGAEVLADARRSLPANALVTAALGRSGMADPSSDGRLSRRAHRCRPGGSSRLRLLQRSAFRALRGRLQRCGAARRPLRRGRRGLRPPSSGGRFQSGSEDAGGLIQRRPCGPRCVRRGAKHLIARGGPPLARAGRNRGLRPTRPRTRERRVRMRPRAGSGRRSVGAAFAVSGASGIHP